MSTYFSADARDLISRMLTTDPKKRIKVMIWLKVQCMLDIVTDLSEK
jgi:serine/threonine protein kinase